MRKTDFCSGLARCTAMALAAAGLAAEARPQARPDASNAKAEVPRAAYDSPFRDYRKFEDQAVTSWRGANDLAYKLGGWKAYASGRVPGDAEPSPADAAPLKSPASPAAASPGHAGHKK